MGAAKTPTAGQGSNDVLRRDARFRRERLVAAAIELYASEGFDVPFEKVADRAGVGRATLYRNFPNRIALSAAVIDARLEELAEAVNQLGDRADAFLVVLRMLAGLVVAASGLEKILPLDQVSPSLTDQFMAGVETLLAAPLARAKAAGLVRQDFDLTDVHMAALMIAGGGLDRHRRDTATNLNRALQLLVRGLAPESGAADSA